MTDSPRFGAHPSPDELADLREGLLAGDVERDLTAHVSACPGCTAEVAALDEVAGLLADAGSAPLAMPDDVADRLDAALGRASAERAAGVPSLADRRASLASRSFKWLGAAAAVVVIGYGSVTALSGSGGSDADSTTAGSAADRAEVQEDAENPAAGGSGGGASGEENAVKQRLEPQRVTKQNLSSFATSLDQYEGAGQSPRPTAASEYLITDSRTCVIPATADNERAAPVQWRNRVDLAYVVVNTEARVATVYGCETPPERLYSTPY